MELDSSKMPRSAVDEVDSSVIGIVPLCEVKVIGEETMDTVLIAAVNCVVNDDKARFAWREVRSTEPAESNWLSRDPTSGEAIPALVANERKVSRPFAMPSETCLVSDDIVPAVALRNEGAPFAPMGTWPK